MPACCCPQYFFLRTAFHFFMINGKFGLEWKRFGGGNALVLNPRKMSMTDGLSDCPEEGVQASGTTAMCVSAWGWQSCLHLPGGWRHPSLDSPVVEVWPCYLLGERKDSNDVPWTELLTALSFYFFFFKWKVFVPGICNLLRFLRVHLSYSLLQPLQLIFSEAYNVGNSLVQFLFSLWFIHLEISFTAHPQPLCLCHLSSPWHS